MQSNNKYKIVLELSDDPITPDNFRLMIMTMYFNGIQVSSEKVINKDVTKADFDYFTQEMVYKLKSNLSFTCKSS